MTSLMPPTYGALATASAQPPGEAAAGPGRLLALVEAVGVEPAVSAVELEVARAVLHRPGLGGVEELLADALRPPGRVDGQVLDPRALAEAHRREVEHDGAEAAQVVGHEDARAVAVD